MSSHDTSSKVSQRNRSVTTTPAGLFSRNTTCGRAQLIVSADRAGFSCSHQYYPESIVRGRRHRSKDSVRECLLTSCLNYTRCDYVLVCSLPFESTNRVSGASCVAGLAPGTYHAQFEPTRPGTTWGTAQCYPGLSQRYIKYVHTSQSICNRFTIISTPSSSIITLTHLSTEFTAC